MDDKRFDFSGIVPWRKSGKQVVYGSEYTKMDDNNSFDGILSQLEFPLQTKKPALFDAMSRFRVKGMFEHQVAGAGAWLPTPFAEAVKVAVYPLWFEKLFRNKDIFHESYQIKTGEEPMFVEPHLNQFLYHIMDPELKKFLCPEACHPGNGVPLNAGSWHFNDKSEWLAYAKHIFTGAEIAFTWIPLFMFPFYQGSNHIYDEEQVPKCVPLNHTGKLTMRMKLVDDMSIIFKTKSTEETNKYRCRLISMDLMVEEARMSPLIETKLFKNNKSLLYYHGVCKLGRAESIPDTTFAFQTRFEDVMLPESIFIFALNKKVVGGTWSYKSQLDSPAPFFLKHNIKKVSLNFAGLNFSLEEPQIGHVDNDYMDNRNWLEETRRGPFGIKVNHKACSVRGTKGGYNDTDFPHIFISLTTNGRHRLVPLLSEPSVLNKNGDLNIALSFNQNGSADSAQYFIYLSYTDVNLVLDMKRKKFLSPFNLI